MADDETTFGDPPEMPAFGDRPEGTFPEGRGELPPLTADDATGLSPFGLTDDLGEPTFMGVVKGELQPEQRRDLRDRYNREEITQVEYEDLLQTSRPDIEVFQYQQEDGPDIAEFRRAGEESAFMLWAREQPDAEVTEEDAVAIRRALAR